MSSEPGESHTMPSQPELRRQPTSQLDLGPDAGLFGLSGLERELAEILGVDIDVAPVDRSHAAGSSTATS